MKPASAEVSHRTVTPYLKLPNCGRLLEFLKQAFGAVEQGKLSQPDGTVLHAEVMIGDTLLMVHELPSPGKPKPGSLYCRGRCRRDLQAGDRSRWYRGVRTGEHVLRHGSPALRTWRESTGGLRCKRRICRSRRLRSGRRSS